MALNTWRRQIKASRTTQFLDDVNEAAFKFVTTVQQPIDAHKHLRIRIWSHTDLEEGNFELTLDDVVRYYHNPNSDVSGSFDKLLLSSLKESNEANAVLTALLYQGQIHTLKNYSILSYHLQRMQWQHNRLSGLFRIITLDHLNTSNPKTSRILQRIADLDSDLMFHQLNNDYKKVIEHLRDEYSAVLK